MESHQSLPKNTIETNIRYPTDYDQGYTGGTNQSQKAYNKFRIINQTQYDNQFPSLEQRLQIIQQIKVVQWNIFSMNKSDKNKFIRKRDLIKQLKPHLAIINENRHQFQLKNYNCIESIPEQISIRNSQEKGLKINSVLLIKEGIKIEEVIKAKNLVIAHLLIANIKKKILAILSPKIKLRILLHSLKKNYLQNGNLKQKLYYYPQR